MPVVFDEVVGTVEPETRSAQESGADSTAGTAQPPDPLLLRRELHRQQVRQARLRAD